MIVYIASLIISSILISGCGSDKTSIPLPRQKFEMQKIDLPDGAVYVEVDSVETRKTCTPVVLEVSQVLRGVIGFYEYQVDEYMKYTESNITKEAK